MGFVGGRGGNNNTTNYSTQQLVVDLERVTRRSGKQEYARVREKEKEISNTRRIKHENIVSSVYSQLN